MALPTYLDLVNAVLVRLREPEVSTVQENTLSKLVGKLVNDAKRTVENSYNWNALTDTLILTTTAGTFSYSLTGSGSRFKVIDAYNVTQRIEMYAISTREMTQRYLSATTTPTGAPYNYNFNGVDANGDTEVDFYPSPDAVYNVYFNVYVPDGSLESDTDTMKVPYEPVEALAYAMALVERGEDGGLQSSESYGMYKMILSDAISIEASRYPEEEAWEAK